jgi:hypothetical protein
MPDMPIWIFAVVSLAVLWAGILVGSWIGQNRRAVVESESKTLTVLEGALLTLFGLLIGFTFSMAVSRYDLRKSLAVQEANAVGTTWLRTGLLPEPQRTEEQNLLRAYVQQRLFYHKTFHKRHELQDTVEQTEKIRDSLWAIASNYASDHREPVTGLYLQSLNNAIDLAGERIAADENRIPPEAWFMLLFVGFVSTAVTGTKIGAHRWVLQLILPVVLAATLAMTLDLDSPRYGFIHISQANMEKVADDMSRLPQQMP